nr:RNA polymerase sigma factor [Lachnospiraceae bacterium]
QGDANAFEELYSATNKRVYFVCLHFLRNEHDANDAIQDTYIKAYKNIKQLSEPSKFPSWVERIAVNVCKEMARKNVPAPVEDEILSETIETEDELVLPEKYIIDAEKRKILIDIMQETLSELQYKTVLLYYFGSYSVAEIAEMMECSEGAVKNRLATARAKIKTAVEEKEKETKDKLFVFVGVPFLAKVFEEESKTVNAPELNKAMLSNKGVLEGLLEGNILIAGKEISKKLLAGALAGTIAVIAIMSSVIKKDSSNNITSTESPVMATMSAAEEEFYNNHIKLTEELKPTESAIKEEEKPFVWETREVKDPVIKDAIVTEHSDVIIDGKAILKYEPAIYLEYEKAEKYIKENPLFSSLEYVDFEKEENGFIYTDTGVYGNYGECIMPKHTKCFVGYSKIDEEIKKENTSNVSCSSYPKDGDIRIIIQRDYTNFDKPDSADIKFKYDKYTQEEMYEVLANMYNEEIAEYLVYHPADREDSEESVFKAEIQTSDGKYKYLFKRWASSYSVDFEITANVQFVISKQAFANNYQLMEWEIPIGDIVPADVGSTDLLKPAEYFTNILNGENKYDPYTMSSLDREEHVILRYSDNTVIESFNIKGNRISEPTEKTSLQGSLEGCFTDQRFEGKRGFYFDGCITKNPDGTIDIYELTAKIPTTFHRVVDYDANITDECFEMAKKQAISVYGLNETIFDGKEVKEEKVDRGVMEQSRDLKLKLKDVPVKIFGQERNVILEVGAHGEGLKLDTAVQRSTYYSDCKIEIEKK